MIFNQKSARFFFEDECHLMWGDVCGYVWGPQSDRVKIPIVNEQKRQSYFGALDLYTGRATILMQRMATSHCHPFSHCKCIFDAIKLCIY